MNCENFTNYIDNVNDICGNDIAVVKDECNIICMTSIMILINHCLNFLKVINIETELEQIIEWCYYKKVENEIYGDGH